MPWVSIEEQEVQWVVQTMGPPLDFGSTADTLTLVVWLLSLKASTMTNDVPNYRREGIGES